MFNRTVARSAIKAFNTTARPATRATFTRPLSYTSTRANKKNDPKNDPLLAATNQAPDGASGEHEGQFARTDESVQIEYPPDSEMPAQPVVQGRGGMHFKRTLAQFSLESKVSMVTGGARGLGLVMGQGLVASGSDLAIVDLNSMFALAKAAPVLTSPAMGLYLYFWLGTNCCMQRLRLRSRLRSLSSNSAKKTQV